jgi:hypothetical protein
VAQTLHAAALAADARISAIAAWSRHGALVGLASFHGVPRHWYWMTIVTMAFVFAGMVIAIVRLA